MNKTFFSTSRFSGQSIRRVLPLCAAILVLSASARAQKAAPSAGNFQYKADKISITTTGVRLDGNAQITSPQLEVRAGAIAFDFQKNQITEVRAINNVRLKVSLTPKGGGVLTRIETTSDSATLKPVTRELTLTGNVDGFYQQAGGPKTTLAGTKVVMRYIGENLDGVISGPISLSVPAEAVPAGATNSAAIGSVKITADGAKIDGKEGVVRFVGNAHAVSTDGPNKFDIAANEFVLTRSATNTIDTLKTSGRTRLKIDLPAEPTVAGDVKTMGKPTRVEVESDSATVSRLTNTLTFEGNVTGFYFLAPAGGEPQKYDFNGNKAVLRSIPENQATAENPAGLKAEITGTPGKPVEVLTPAFSLDMGN